MYGKVLQRNFHASTRYNGCFRTHQIAISNNSLSDQQTAMNRSRHVYRGRCLTHRTERAFKYDLQAIVWRGWYSVCTPYTVLRPCRLTTCRVRVLDFRVRSPLPISRIWPLTQLCFYGLYVNLDLTVGRAEPGAGLTFDSAKRRTYNPPVTVRQATFPRH